MKTNFVDEVIPNYSLTGQMLTILGDESSAELKPVLLSPVAAILVHTGTLVLRLLFPWLLCR